ncbi:MAG TPA: CRTAC1 family protein [Pirellulaceae bacterium]|nr:CRTAC1 family protein [Pirellulaceae bacterium]
MIVCAKCGPLAPRVAQLIVCMLLLGPPAAQAQNPFAFRDAGDEAGLFPHVGGIAGHGVGWGDVDGDGWPDLYVGTFGGYPYDSKPNLFFRNQKGKFVLDEQPQLRVLGRANGAVFADLDNDGDLDLYTTNHAIEFAGQPHFQEPNHLFRNDGGGKFTDVSAASNACARGYACRSVCVLDYDGDGLLDLLVGECFFQGGTSRSRLYRNKGGLVFEDVTAAAGLPNQVTGFGVAAGDVNGDTIPDIVLGGRHHGNRLFLGQAGGKFVEVPKSHANFEWEYKDTNDDTPCGVCIADVNGDGLADIVIGSHYDRPWFTGGVPMRLYLNRGVTAGLPKFEDVTAAAGLIPLPMKSPHVEIQDFDNDGRMDIYTSIVKFDAGGTPYPVIFHNEGSSGGVPRFKEYALAVNDFPTEAEGKQGDVTTIFKQMENEKQIIYMAPGPSCDYDRDGRLDLFLANWFVSGRSLLLKNESPAANWLDVSLTRSVSEGQTPTRSVSEGKPLNPHAIGAVIRLYPAGKLGQADALLASKEIAVGYGYASGQEAIAHFGLGKIDKVDLEVILPHNAGKIEKKDVAANQRVTLTGVNP